LGRSYLTTELWDDEAWEVFATRQVHEANAPRATACSPYDPFTHSTKEASMTRSRSITFLASLVCDQAVAYRGPADVARFYRPCYRRASQM
jgi:hypothetical protein